MKEKKTIVPPTHGWMEVFDMCELMGKLGAGLWCFVQIELCKVTCLCVNALSIFV